MRIRIKASILISITKGMNNKLLLTCLFLPDLWTYPTAHPALEEDDEQWDALAHMKPLSPSIKTRG